MQTTSCPECGAIAEIEWREVMESTDGPVEHAKIRCIDRHWFLLPVASLESPTVEVRADSPMVEVRADSPVVEVRADSPVVEVRAERASKPRDVSRLG